MRYSKSINIFDMFFTMLISLLAKSISAYMPPNTDVLGNEMIK